MLTCESHPDHHHHHHHEAPTSTQNAREIKSGDPEEELGRVLFDE